MLGHPAKRELMAHAESLVDGLGISTEIARHVASCAGCASEVRAMRESLAFVRAAEGPEPSSDATSQLLVAAREERAALRRARNRMRPVVLAAKGLAYAACLAILATVSFRAALGHGAVTASQARPAAPPRMAASVPSAEDLRRTESAVHTLALAVGSRPANQPSLQELYHTRTVRAVGDDLAAARAALERNPGSARATLLWNANLQTQEKALKALYVERSL
jgi:hypothetical protein